MKKHIVLLFLTAILVGGWACKNKITEDEAVKPLVKTPVNTLSQADSLNCVKKWQNFLQGTMLTLTPFTLEYQKPFFLSNGRDSLEILLTKVILDYCPVNEEATTDYCDRFVRIQLRVNKSCTVLLDTVKLQRINQDSTVRTISFLRSLNYGCSEALPTGFVFIEKRVGFQTGINFDGGYLRFEELRPNGITQADILNLNNNPQRYRVYGWLGWCGRND